MTMFNEETFVEQAIRSVLAQTFREFELIVVDDGSTDASREIVERFDDSRVRLIAQPNCGLASALNRGIIEAQAPWIARHDADDVSLPQRFAEQMASLANSEVVLLGANAVLTDEEDRPVIETEFPEDDASLRKLLFAGVNPFVHGAVLFRRDAAVDVGLYRSEFRQSQDFDLWLRLASRGRLASLGTTLYRWRMRRGGVGVSKSETQRDYGRLALICAQRRAQDLPEPVLDLATVQRHGPGRVLARLREVEAFTSYDFSLAKLLLRAGDSRRARAHARAVVRVHPFNLYARLLFLLTFAPPALAHRIWTVSTRFYRGMIWRGMQER